MKRQKSMIRTLTNRSFKANKTRNLVAIFAIVLTTVMFTSLFVLSQSMVENLRNMNFQQAGYNSHLSSGIMTDADVEKITTHEAVRDFGKSIVVGIAENKELTGRQVEIRYADENYARSSFSYPTEGTMPVQENEIALDTITLDKMGLPYELGQKITLQWRKDLNGEEITTSIFTLSGYWNGNSAAMASMAWVSEAFVQSQCAGIDQVEQLANGQVLGTVMLHIDLYSDSNLEGAAEQILADTGLSNVSLSPNAAYDSTMNQNINREVLPMAICMVLVFASGYLIIYNIFQISVASDIRFYGRLKTLGTTKRQLKKMIYGQANRLSLIGIPIGLVIGYLLGAVLVPVMITGTTGEAKTAVNPYIFIGSALFAYLTVLISCMKPAKIAGKVSPMEALRYRCTKRRMAKDADMILSEFILLGIGGKELSEENAAQTAKALNIIQPDFIRVHATGIKLESKLGEFVRDGSFTLQSEEEIVIEQKLFLQQLHEMDSYYVNEHIVNLLLEVRGNLRTEKQEMLSTIDRFLTLPPDERLLFTVGRRLNIFFRLDDLKKPKLHQKAGESLQQILSKNPHVDFAALCNYVRQSQI